MMSNKKLIEAALPMEAITMEAARAVICSSLVGDHSSLPEQFPTEKAQTAELQAAAHQGEQQALFGMEE
jgi:hypothetical protein